MKNCFTEYIFVIPITVTSLFNLCVSRTLLVSKFDISRFHSKNIAKELGSKSNNINGGVGGGGEKKKKAKEEEHK